MRLGIFTLCSLLTFVLATNLQDRSDIRDLTAFFDFLIDEKKYNEFGKVLSPDVTYDSGEGPVQGPSAAIDVLSKLIPNTTTTYNTLGTQLIKFFPPFEKDKRSNLAESISYTTLASFDSGNLTGQDFTIFTKYTDKEIVRISEPGFGGWRFKNQKFELVVSFLTRHCCHVSSKQTSPPPPPHFPLVALKSKNSPLILAIFREYLSNTALFWDYHQVSNRHVC